MTEKWVDIASDTIATTLGAEDRKAWVAEYLKENFIPRMRVEAAVIKERQQAGWEFVHAVSVLKKLLGEQDE